MSALGGKRTFVRGRAKWAQWGKAEAQRVTPAMRLGVTDDVWTISELVEAALHAVVTIAPQGRKVGRFTVAMVEPLSKKFSE
jgi:hypothetical protein